MIEGLILGAVLTTSLLFLIRYGLMIQQSLLIDELIEKTLLCIASDEPRCDENFRRQLTDLNFISIQVFSKKTQNLSTLKLSAQSGFGQNFEKESELELDLTIQ